MVLSQCTILDWKDWRPWPENVSSVPEQLLSRHADSRHGAGEQSQHQHRWHPYPIRPHVNLNNTINVDVKARTFREIDLSENCRADERIKVKGKREWRCRQDR
jgi:hypothetical protein